MFDDARGRGKRIVPTALVCGFFVLAALLLPAMLPSPSAAGHDMGLQCYYCHNIRSGQVWVGSYSIWAPRPIGVSCTSELSACSAV